MILQKNTLNSDRGTHIGVGNASLDVPLKGRLLLQGPLIGSVPSVALRHLPTPWGVTLFRKQFTGLFSEFTLAMRLRIISLFFKSWEQRPETLSLDSAKGTQSLWNPFHGLGKLLRYLIIYKSHSTSDTMAFMFYFKNPLIICSSASASVRPRVMSFMSCSPAIFPIAAS